MTDNEIIKTLECCRDDTCVSCPICTEGLCNGGLHKNTLDLINRQKAEIESLKHRKTELQIRNQELQHEKSEAIKEFAEGLCDGRVSNDPVVIAVKTELQMTEGQKK